MHKNFERRVNQKSTELLGTKCFQSNGNLALSMPHTIGSITKTRPCNIQRFFTAVKMTISVDLFNYFHIFAKKNRLWGHVRTASLRRLYRVPTVYVLEQKQENNVYPCKPQFYYIKVGCKGSTLHGHDR